MTIQDDFEAFRDFATTDAECEFWAFRKRTLPQGSTSRLFRSTSITIDDSLIAALKEIVRIFQQQYGEVDLYSPLAQSSEAGFLGIDQAETNFPDLKLSIIQPAAENLATTLKQLSNADGYAFSLQTNNVSLVAVHRASADWSTKKARSWMNVVFANATMTLAENPAFTIAKSFDFFAIGQSILIRNKAAFESMLQHKADYQAAFLELQGEAAFAAAFSDMQPLIDYVGTNANHLRRAVVIKERAYYNNPQYMAKIREISNLRGWNLQFDIDGKIIPTAASAPDILKVLLDQRLRSEISENQYDVPYGTLVR